MHGNNTEDEVSTPTNLEPEEILSVEIGPFATKIVCVEALGHARILKDYHISDSLLITDSSKVKVDDARLSKILRQFRSTTKNVVVVLNGLNAFTLIHRVPIAMEADLRAHVQDVLLRKNKLELSHYFWTATPLSDGRNVQSASLTDSFSNDLGVLVCGARKVVIDAITAAFHKQGYDVSSVVFQLPCLIKAFEMFGGDLLEDQLVALLHLGQDRYGISILKNGSLVTHRESRLGADPEEKRSVHQELKTCMASVEAKFKVPVKCVFVSGDGAGQDSFADELKANGFYARGWNVARKISIELESPKPKTILVDGPQLNAVVGAAVASLKKQTTSSGSAYDDEDEAALRKMFVRPLAIAACLMLPVLSFFIAQNLLIGKTLNALRKTQVSEQRDTKPLKSTAEKLSRNVHELEAFAGARTLWSPIVAELKSSATPNVTLVQVKGSETIGIAEPNPFAQSKIAQFKRKNTGAFVVEARNTGGLMSLEEFMSSVTTNHAIAPLLNKRKPLRLVNNFESGEGAEPSLFTVEYLLEEKSF